MMYDTRRIWGYSLYEIKEFIENNMKLSDEKLIDEQYGIDTCGRDDTKEDNEHRAYEPTPYDVLELIKDSGVVESTDCLVDMGCGKGRVALYFARETGCKTKGIDYDERLIDLANENLWKLQNKLKASFICDSAENYRISEEDNVFFFFNPFSEKILETVLSNIEKSYYDNPREIKLIFYYPTLEYVGRLMTKDYLDFIDEIDCSMLYKDEKGRECVMIFGITN